MTEFVEIKPGVKISETVIKRAAAGSLPARQILGKYNVAVRKYGKDTIAVESADAKKTFYQASVQKVASDVLKDVEAGKERVVSGPVAERLAKEGYITEEAAKDEVKTEKLKVAKVIAKAPSVSDAAVRAAPDLKTVPPKVFPSGDISLVSTLPKFGTYTSVPPADIGKEQQRLLGEAAKKFVLKRKEEEEKKKVEFAKETFQARVSGIESSPKEQFQKYVETFGVPSEQVKAPEVPTVAEVKFSEYSPYSVKLETLTFSPTKITVKGKDYFAFDAGRYSAADLTWYAKKIGYGGTIYSFENKYLLDVPNAPSLTTTRAVVQEPLFGSVGGTPIKTAEGVYVYDVEPKSGYMFSVPKENYDAFLSALMESGKVKAKYTASYGSGIVNMLREKGEAAVRFVSRQPAGYEVSKDFKIVDAGDKLFVYTSDPSFREYLNVAEQKKMQGEMLKYQAEKLYLSENELDRTLRSLTKTIAPVQMIKAGIVSKEEGVSYGEALSKVRREEALKGYEDYLKWATGKKDAGSTLSFLWSQSGVRVPAEMLGAWGVGAAAGTLPLSGEKFALAGRVLSVGAGTALGVSWSPSIVQSVKGEKPWSETSQSITESVFDLEAMRSGFVLGFEQTKDVGARVRFLIEERKLEPVVGLGKGKAYIGAKVPLSYKDMGPSPFGKAREGFVQVAYKVTPRGRIVMEYPARDMLLAPITRYGVKAYPFSYAKFPMERLKADVEYVLKGVREPWKVAYIAGTDTAIKWSPEVKGTGEVSFERSEMLDMRKVLKEDVFFKKFSEGWTKIGTAETGYKYSLKPEYSKDLEKIIFVSGAGVKEYPAGRIAVADRPLESLLTRQLLENVQRSRVLGGLSPKLEMKALKGGDFKWKVRDELFGKLYKKYPEYFFRETEGVIPYTEAKQFMIEASGKPVSESYLISQRFVEKEPSPFFKAVTREGLLKSQLVETGKAKADISLKSLLKSQLVETGKAKADISLKTAPFVISMPADKGTVGSLEDKGTVGSLTVVSLGESLQYLVSFPVVKLDTKVETKSLVESKPSLKTEPFLKIETVLEPSLKMEPSLKTEPSLALEPSLKTEPVLESRIEPVLEPVLEPALEPKIESVLEPRAGLFVGIVGVPFVSLDKDEERKKKRKKEEYAVLEKTKIKTPRTYLFPDLYSAMVSQAAFGKATIPEFTPEEKVKFYEKGLIRVPTKEYKGIGSSKEMWKKILG